MMFRAWLRSRLFAASVVAVLALFSSGRAQAQLLGTGGTGLTTGTGGTSGTSTFSSTDFFVGVQQTQGVNLSAFDVARFFNQAHCDCSTPVDLFIAIQPQSVAKRTTLTNVQGNITVLLGTDCVSPLDENIANCILLAQEPTLTFLNDTSYTIKTNARALSTFLNPTVATLDAGTSVDASAVLGTSTGACSATGQFDQTINVLIDFTGDGNPDVTISSSLLIDLSPPPQPTNVTIQGGDEALIMKWTAVDTSLTTDLLGYQILCSRADQYQVFNESPNDGGATGAFNAGFLTCPLTQPGMGLDGSIESSAPNFVCSPLLSAVATSYRVEILQNDITYAASVVAVDNSGNASAPIVGYGKPIKTLSFYEVYRNGNPQDAGSASGGFCALATSRPRLTSTLGSLLALGLGAFGVVRSRRRRGRR
ncbi:MAG TPA: hypothetical protein VFG23_13465 [Polyangia bacterium]|nr:hypothetical protein [Polyangia bacterium]